MSEVTDPECRDQGILPGCQLLWVNDKPVATHLAAKRMINNAPLPITLVFMRPKTDAEKKKTQAAKLRVRQNAQRELEERYRSLQSQQRTRRTLHYLPKPQELNDKIKKQLHQLDLMGCMTKAVKTELVAADDMYDEFILLDAKIAEHLERKRLEFRRGMQEFEKNNTEFERGMQEWEKMRDELNVDIKKLLDEPDM